MRRLFPLLLLGIARVACAQDGMDAVEIKTTDLGAGLHLLVGRGGNVLASAGADGVFLVDDQYAPLTPKIRAALATITDAPVRFVINTHWHGDHTGGNESLAAQGAVIVAHDNVRKRMSSDQFIAALNVRAPAAPAAALPVVSFAEQVTLHLNGDDAQVIHVAHAHTDGDALVHFPHANVLHMGDLYWNGMYPLIDLSSGGAIDGMIAGVERGLALCDERTKVIPGHGPLSDRAGLAAFGRVLTTARERVAALKRKGKSLEQVVAAAPLAEYEATLGKGHITTAQFVGFVYDSLPAGKARGK
jgi:glyoxylase-like metal-dependent hydrolase (beta-lactamase superfamily II)